MVQPPAGGFDACQDDALMTLVAAGRRDAFAALARRHVGRLAGFCAKCAGGARVGEELAQEVLLEVWSQRVAYRPSGRFETWLFTLARHRCLNHVRAERRRGRWPPGEQGAAPDVEAGALAPDQVDRLLEAERVRRVHVALLGLSAKLREAVLLRFDQGLDYAEIGRAVGAPEVTVRSRVFLAVRALRAVLAREEEP